MTKPTWTTKDGRSLTPSQMSDQHLLNLDRFLRRRVKLFRQVIEARCFVGLLAMPSYQQLGDGAELAVEQEMGELIRECDFFTFTASPEEVLATAVPVWSALQAELVKRKLKPPPRAMEEQSYHMERKRTHAKH